MADTKITSLLTPQVTTNPATDVLPIVNIADTSMASSGSTRKITVNTLLGAGGTATLASATITGDLTVDTSTLKVDSTNNTVGIGNATPPTGASNTDIGLTLGAAGTVRSILLGMQNCFGRIRERDATNNLAITTNIGATGTIDDNTRSSWKIRIGSGNDNYALQRAAIGSSTFNDLLAIDSGGVCVWSDGAGGTRMTLNATGLGIGVSPATKFHVKGGLPVFRLDNSSTGLNQLDTGVDSQGAYFRTYVVDGIRWYNNAGGIPMTLDATGNVGIGVTPSAWATTGGYKALQVGGVGIYGRNTASNELVLSSNCYFDATDSRWEYITTAASTRYDQQYGVHQWFNAPSGTAGNAITFTQAMTLDASGNLLVGTTSASGSISNATKTLGGIFSTLIGNTGSIATATATTMFAAPSESTLMVTAYITGSSAPLNYNAVSIVKVSGGTAAITAISTALNLTITLSGANVQVTQTSGVNQTVQFNVLRLS